MNRISLIQTIFSPSNAAFKTKLLSKICPLPKSVFRKHHPTRLGHLTQLTVDLSKLNFHKFKHNFRDTINPMWPTNDGIEIQSINIRRQEHHNTTQKKRRLLFLLRCIVVFLPSNIFTCSSLQAPSIFPPTKIQRTACHRGFSSIQFIIQSISCYVALR